MPHDGDVTRFEPVVVPVVKPFDFETATGDERLLELAWYLENEQQWRDSKMEWDYYAEERVGKFCQTSGCAMGLALILWPRYRDMHNLDCFCENDAFEFTRTESCWLFYGEAYGHIDDVTPRMVATAIRTFVANRQAAS